MPAIVCAFRPGELEGVELPGVGAGEGLGLGGGGVKSVLNRQSWIICDPAHPS